MLWTDFMWMRKLCLDFKGFPQFGHWSSGRITCFPSICRETSVFEAKICGQILQTHLRGPVSWLTEQFSLMNSGSWSRERWTGALVYPRKKCKCWQLSLYYFTILILCLILKVHWPIKEKFLKFSHNLDNKDLLWLIVNIEKWYCVHSSCASSLSDWSSQPCCTCCNIEEGAPHAWLLCASLRRAYWQKLPHICCITSVQYLDLC